MRWWWLVAMLLGCGTEPADPVAPIREREVLVDVSSPAGHVIYQDGDRPWQLAPRLTDTRYGFDVEGTRYGVALVCVDASVQQLELVLATPEERPDVVLHPGCDVPPVPTPHMLRGTVGGLASQDYTVSTATLSSEFEDPAYAVPVSDAGQTLVFARQTPVPDLVVIRRDVPIGADRVEDVDFERDGVATTTYTFATPGADLGIFATVEAAFVASGTALPLVVSTAGDSSRLRVPASAQWRGGDHLDLAIRTSEPQGGVRRVIRALSSPDDLPAGFELPMPFGAADVTRLSPDRYQVAWSPYETAPIEVGLSAEVGDATCAFARCAPRWRIEISPGWPSDPGTPRAALLAPADLISLGVWDPRLALVETSDLIAWTVAAQLPGGAAAGRQGSVVPAGLR